MDWGDDELDSTLCTKGFVFDEPSYSTPQTYDFRIPPNTKLNVVYGEPAYAQPIPCLVDRYSCVRLIHSLVQLLIRLQRALRAALVICALLDWVKTRWELTSRSSSNSANNPCTLTRESLCRPSLTCPGGPLRRSSRASVAFLQTVFLRNSDPSIVDRCCPRRSARCFCDVGP